MRMFLGFAILAALLTAGCGSAGIRGSGNVVTEPRNVANFTQVILRGSGQLVLDQNGTESLTITADDNLLPYLTSDIDGNRLTLGTKDSTNVSPSKDIIYKVSAKNLNGLQVAGSGSADAKGIKTERLSILIAGSGSVSIAGSADEQDITLAGSGGYQGKDLRSKMATVNITGSGNVDLNASDKLNAIIVGSGDIRYTGEPTITKQVLGSGSIVKR